MTHHTLLSGGIIQRFISFASRMNVKLIILGICLFSVVFVILVFKEVAMFTRMKTMGILTSQSVNTREQDNRYDVDDISLTDHLRTTSQEPFIQNTTHLLKSTVYDPDLVRRMEAKKIWAARDPLTDVDVYQRLLAMKDLLNDANKEDWATDEYPAFDAKILPAVIENRLPVLNTSKLTPQDTVWQIVSGTSHKVLVYSAFYDRRVPRCVRVMAVTDGPSAGGVWCRLWYYNRSEVAAPETIHSLSVPAQVMPALFVCPLEELAVPKAVSLVGRLRLPPTNLLLVRNTDEDLVARNISIPVPPHPIADAATIHNVTMETTMAIAKNMTSYSVFNETSQPTHITELATNATKERHQQDTTPTTTPSKSSTLRENVDPKTAQVTPKSIALCVKPLYKTCDEMTRLLEFIEVHMLMGVNHFFLYNYTLQPHAECLVRDYIAHGIVTLLPWYSEQLPRSKVNNSLLASINDCLHRTMYAFDLTTFVDLGEYIMPRKHHTLPEFFTWLNTNTSKSIISQTGAYFFQHVYFDLRWSSDLGEKIWQQDLLEGKHRRNKPPSGLKESYICRPERIVTADEHFVSEFVSGFNALYVPIHAAKLYYHRRCEFAAAKCWNSTSVIDGTVDRFRNLVQMALNKRIPQLRSCLKEYQSNFNSTKKSVMFC